MKIRLKCRNCGKYFLVYPYMEHSAKFCSRNCYHSSDEKKEKFRKLALNQFRNGMPKSTRIKLSKANKGKRNSPKTEFKKGRIETPEQVKKRKGTLRRRFDDEQIRFKRIKKMKKYLWTPESIRKSAQSRKGLKGKKTFLGKKHSEKTKKILSEKKKEFYRDNPKEKEKAVQRLNEKRKEMVFPKKDTSIEIKIQNFLKQLGIEFFTHQYMKEIEHSYQCDILIPSMNLVIECDGNYWHKYPVGREIDHIRTSELIEKGFMVLRLWGHEIREMELNDFRGILLK